MLSLFMLDLEDWLHDLRDKIKKNPLYFIPYFFLIGVIIFAIILGIAVRILQDDGLPK